MRKALTTFCKSAALVISIAATTVAPSWAGQDLMWDDLLPNIAPLNDPFEKLTTPQLFSMGRIARLEAKAELSQEEQDKLANMRAELEEQGVDIDYLFGLRSAIAQQRKARAMMANQALDGGRFRVPGFITPLEMDGEKVVQFFLVPTGGACVHTPPPPANQIVLVDYPQGLVMGSLYDPVWVEGVIEVEANNVDVAFTDGELGIDAAYTMQGIKIEAYEPQR